MFIHIKCSFLISMQQVFKDDMENVQGYMTKEHTGWFLSTP